MDQVTIKNIFPRYKWTLVFLLGLSHANILAQENTTVSTDSSVIETSYHEAYNYILILNNLKKSTKSYYKELYFDSRKLKETGTFLDGEYYNIRKEYWPSGKPKSIIDYTKGKILYYDKRAYPYFGYQNQIKFKADSILKRIYSEDFFREHLVWDIGHSTIYSDMYPGDWIEKLPHKPSRFLLRYLVIYNNARYPEMISFELNSDGQLINKESAIGIESPPPNYPRNFKLTPEKALLLAKQRGLAETPLNKGYSILVREIQQPAQKGHFNIYVTIKTGSIKDINPKGRSTQIDKFDVYVFNPWTGDFIEKKKMKNIKGWEQMSGSSTGLISDN
nr:hypothetical protein [uncultured Mucilaginibacter sp.]